MCNNESKVRKKSTASYERNALNESRKEEENRGKLRERGTKDKRPAPPHLLLVTASDHGTRT